jgi:AcrR family transcriptional regulator
MLDSMSSDSPQYGDPATRKRILDAAWELLEEGGRSVRVADVADRAGVSRQAVYLHFRDRGRLFVALGDHIDVSLGRDRLREHVFGAPSGVESLRRWVQTMSWYHAKIDRVTRILEEGAETDAALAAVLKDRMAGRRNHVRRIAGRLADEGLLREGWTPSAAADLIYTVTLPGGWRILTRTLGWSEDRYATGVTQLLERSLLADSAG